MKMIYFSALVVIATMSFSTSALAMPIQAEALCAKMSQLKSIASKAPAKMTVINQSADPVDFKWINFNGGLDKYATIAPGKTFNQDTYVGHQWVIADKTGKCLGAFVATESPLTVNVP